MSSLNNNIQIYLIECHKVHTEWQSSLHVHTHIRQYVFVCTRQGRLVGLKDESRNVSRRRRNAIFSDENVKVVGSDRLPEWLLFRNVHKCLVNVYNEICLRHIGG